MTGRPIRPRALAPGTVLDHAARQGKTMNRAALLGTDGEKLLNPGQPGAALARAGPRRLEKVWDDVLNIGLPGSGKTRGRTRSLHLYRLDSGIDAIEIGADSCEWAKVAFPASGAAIVLRLEEHAVETVHIVDGSTRRFRTV